MVTIWTETLAVAGLDGGDWELGGQWREDSTVEYHAVTGVTERSGDGILEWPVLDSSLCSALNSGSNVRPDTICDVRERGSTGKSLHPTATSFPLFNTICRVVTE